MFRNAVGTEELGLGGEERDRCRTSGQVAILESCQLDFKVQCKAKSEYCHQRANLGLSRRLIHVKCSFANLRLGSR